MNEKPKIPESPYVGLIPFAETNADYFFGRTKDIEIVAGNLRAASLTVLYGASGVGKSSLLNAGVVPYLRKIARASALPGDPPEFILAILRDWAMNPSDSLREAIAAAVKEAVKDEKFTHLKTGELEKTAALNRKENDLSKLLKSWTDLIKCDLLIIFDQFEDFFLHPEFRNGAGSFGAEFPKAANNRELPVNFMLSLRDDSLSKLDVFKGQIQDLMKNTLRLSYLDRASTEEAIREPLKKYKKDAGVEYKIEDGLVENLLTGVQVNKIKFEMQGQGAKDSSFETGDLRAPEYKAETTFLQLVMMRLWKDADTQAEKCLKLDTLTKLKGVDGIVKTHLAEVMNLFDASERDLIFRFIRYTITRSGAKIVVSADDLVGLPEVDEAERDKIESVLRRLSTGGTHIFKTVVGGERGKSFYEVAHDALGPAILSWWKEINDAKLKEKLRRDEERKRTEEEEKRRRESEAAEAARNEELKKERREKAEQTAKLKEEREKVLIREKLLAEERRSRSLGRIVVGLTILVLLAVAGGGAFLLNRDNAFKAEEITNKNKELITKTEEISKTTNLKETFGNDFIQYKSLLDIQSELRTGGSETVDIALNRLDEKVNNGELPEEYAPLFIESLKAVKTDSERANALRRKLENYKPQTTAVAPSADAPKVVFIQIQDASQRAAALNVGKLLESQNYLAPGIENVGSRRSVKINQLRYFHDSDKDAAQEICDFLARHGIADVKPILTVGFENSVRQNQFELWFSGDPIQGAAMSAAN